MSLPRKSIPGEIFEEDISFLRSLVGFSMTDAL